MNIHPRIQEFVDALDQQRHRFPPVAVFDCDGTLIKEDVGEAMFRFQVENFLFRESPAEIWTDFPRRQELQTYYDSLSRFQPHIRAEDNRMAVFSEMLYSWYFGQLAQGNTEKACSDIVRLFSGFTQDEIQEMAADTIRLGRTLANSEREDDSRIPQSIRYIIEVCDLLRWLKELEFDVWVISGSNRWSVAEVCRPLGLAIGHVVAIDLISENSFCTSRIIEPVPVLEGKVESLKALGVPRPLLVISDSVYDLPLFQYSHGLKVLVPTSTTEEDFFSTIPEEKDDSWVVLDEPTFE
jgi:phosphoserine phosphatase